MRITPLILVLLSLLTACNVESPSNTGDPPPCDTDCGPPPTGMSLAVADAWSTRRRASRDRVRIHVSFEIANGAQAEPVQLGFPLFSIRTQDGLELRAVASDDACPSEASLLAGASRRCTMIFEANQATTPTLLRYELPKVEGDTVTTRTAEAPIVQFRPCTPCGDTCVDLLSDEKYCGACDVIVQGTRATCVAGTPVCPDNLTFCAGDLYGYGQRCVDISTSTDDCGECGAPVYGGMCSGGTPQCPEDEILCPARATSSKGTICVDPTSTETCGACGKYCPYNNSPYVTKSCVSGRCVGRVANEYNDGRTCDEVCARAGYDRCTGPTVGGFACSERFQHASVTCHCDGEPKSR
ncbi:MAG: hypothetical protein WBV82_17870 [Myxococcaceae bacterium]